MVERQEAESASPTKTPSRDRRQPTREFLLQLWNPLDEIGKALVGSLWRDVYVTIQDAIALGVLLRIPSAIGRLVIGADYSGFDVCLEAGNVWSINRYACFVIVTSGFALWIVLGGRILIRFGRRLIDVAKEVEAEESTRKKESD